MTLTAGSTLGQYRIAAALGAGGMGEVWRAKDTKLGREVALKVLSEEFADNADRLDRFQREARAVAALNHPHIVTIYSVEETEGTHFLTMELIEGQSLDRLIPEGGFGLGEFFELATPLAEAISAAHDKSVIHRDLKPSNVMVDGDGRVKVLDFGLAKLQQADGVSTSTELPTEALTGIGTIVGTVPYMSPEQIEGQIVDHRTDIFSLGVLLYEMATGERPFRGESSPALMSSILRDAPQSVAEIRADLPRHLGRVIGRCLEKDRRDRYQTARDVFSELKALRREASSSTGTGAASLPRVERSKPRQTKPISDLSAAGSIRRDEGFWIAVLPFACRAADPSVEALGGGLTEDIVTGLSRFSYLRVISRSSTSRLAGQTVDVREVGDELGARYVMEGSVRQAGPVLRVAVQLVDAESGANLWAETYNRSFSPESVFELQDDLAPRIVSTVADMNGVLPHTMSESMRSRELDGLSPYEAMLRAFGYYERLTVEDHAEVRSALERAVGDAPDHADCWAMLSMLYAEEHKHGFNPQPDPLGRALEAARRAVAAAPSNNLAYHMLAQAHFFRRELQAFRNAADRAVALNPMDGCTTAFMGILMAYAGDWEHGCALAERAMELNPHHPGWYRFSIAMNRYRKSDYEGALDVALKINMPSYYFTHAFLAAAYGQLGQQKAAGSAVRELLAFKPDFAEEARQEWGKWFGEGELVERMIEGLAKAGLDVGSTTVEGDSATPEAGPTEPTATGPDALPRSIVVLPFVNMSEDSANEFFSDGVTEEILTSLSKIGGLHVVSRTSAMTYKGTTKSVREIAQELGVGSVLEGSVRRAGNRVRVTAQLIEAATDKHLWSESYDRDLEDIFEVQSDVAVEIARALEAELGTDVVAQIRRRPTENMEAYDLYLKGRQGVRTLLAPEVARGIEQLEGAIALDPDFASAWAHLSVAHLFSAYWGAARGREDYDEARKAAEHALDLDPANALARVGRAGVRSHGDLDWEGAVADLREAIELDPSEIDAYFWLGVTFFLMGRFEESVTTHEIAYSMDPQSPNTISQLGLVLCYAGRQEEGECLLREGIEQHPVFFDLPNFLGIVLKRRKLIDEAVRWQDRTSELTGRHPFFEAMRASTLRLAGREAEARQVLDRLEQDDPRTDTVVRAMIAIAERDVDGAIDRLSAAVDQRLPLVFWFRPAVLDEEFPPDHPGVRALYRRLWPEPPAAGPADHSPGNLPESVDSFVAREEELAEVAALLEDARLVTLVGVGGTGKTRLAIETARRGSGEFADGAWLIELAPVTHAEAVPHVVADLIGAVQQPGKTITQSVVDSLRHRALLLVLDNCEHVLDAAAELAEAITTHCAEVRILATSRENLAIRGERVIRLQSLADEHGAVLFRDRAQAAGARGELDMVTLSRLSRRLDGMPLAIELAAARCGSMSPEQIEKRLDDRFRLLRGSRRGRMERHQTLRNTVAWSYELLEKLERQVFDRLSVFAGGFTLEAAQAVAGGGEIGPIDVEDAVTSLVERSMVLASETEDGTRYRLLETLRQYGEEQLVMAGDVARIQDRHVRYFVDFMTEAWAGLWSSDDPPWIRAIGREFENLRVAVYAAIDNEDREALAALLKPHIWWAWHALKYEVGDWAEAALSVSPETACVRAVAAHLFMHGGRPEDAVRLVEESDGRANQGDPDAECLWALARFNWSILTRSPEMMQWMHRWIEAGERTGNLAHTAAIRSIEVVFRVMAGEMAEARRVAETALGEAESTGNQIALCWATFMKGRAYSDSDHGLALECFDRAAEIARRNGLSLNAGFAATEAAVVVARHVEPERGRERLARAIRSFINSGDYRQLWTSAHHLAFFLTRVGRVDDARGIWRELGDRQAWAAQHHRDELEELLGPHGECELSDEQFTERIRGILDSLEGEAA